MAAIFSFKCSCCGEFHEGSPSFGFRAPDPYLEQSEEIQDKGELGSDLCFYEDEDGIHYFARVVLNVPIIGVQEPFLWGVWVSLSKESYDHYIETYDNPDMERIYFGWFSNYLPWYSNTYALATDVFHRNGGDRPYLELHEVENELYNDFKNSISIEKAQEIAEKCMHG